MRHFLRSLRYLWPYRARLGVAVVCVLFIAGLWGGGLGMLLPASKILLSAEGLHGWAWNTLTQDRLGAAVVQRVLSSSLSLEGEPVTVVLDVLAVPAGGRADRAGVRAGDLIVGVEDGNPTHLLIRGDALVRQLALDDSREVVTLRLFNAHTGATRLADVPLGRPSLPSRALGWVARHVREPAQYAGRFNMFARLLVLALAVTFARAGFTFVQEYLVGTAIWRGVMDLRSHNFERVLHLPTAFFSEKGVSDATSRFIQDTNELARGQNTLLGKTLVEPAKAVGALLLALSLSWQLTLAAMLGGPPTFLLIRKFGKKMHRASRRALESWSGMLAVLGETLLGIRVVKAYTMEAAQRKRFFRVNRQLLKQQMRMERLDAATGPLVEALGMAAGMLAAAGAGYLVFRGLSVGGYVYRMGRDEFLTWMVALFAMFDPVRKLAKVSMRFQQADAAAQRVFELRDAEPETVRPGAPPLPTHSRSIEFRDVRFRYPGAEDDALRGVSLTISARSTLAIVGPNGSGKTTLVSLVPRLFDPFSGQVLIDGLDIAQHSLRSLRRQIGLMTQDPVLFHATIAENIACGRRRADRGAVVEASRKAFVDEFVRDLPAGYDTVLGEHGMTLSGGQRQRVAIARAILRDPAILIFDEALSQIDPDSERKIHQALEEFRRGRTTLVVAHRFTTILEADRIAVMDAGRIVDVGTHQDLLARCPLYRKLHDTQFADPRHGGGG